MTYCVAIRLKAGMIFASDSRTSAGVDNISTFCKMHRFKRQGEREIFLLSAGNLGTTQEVLSVLRIEIERSEAQNILELESMFKVARKVGEIVRGVIARLSAHCQHGNVDFSCSFLLGGQIKGEEQRLFLIYAAGNFIEATHETAFFQVGELKYGKPILDRVINYATSVNNAIKCTLISFDSTMRSNLSVGLPLNLAFLPRQDEQIAEIATPLTHLIDENHESYQRLRQEWSLGLQQAFAQIHNPNWWDLP